MIPASGDAFDPIARSRVPGIVWPALLDEAGSRALALQFQFSYSQWWPPERLRAHQHRQLAVLLRHALDTVPYYRDALPAGLLGADGSFNEDRWSEVPLLRRETVQRDGARLTSTAPPPEHGAIAVVRTSGSTGRPVEVSRTVLARHFWHGFALRDHLWHGRDLAGKLVAIRFADPRLVPADGFHRQGWGKSTDLAFDTGPGVLLSVHIDVVRQAEFLRREDPDYLLSYPSNLQALATHFLDSGLRLPRLRQVRSIGETLTGDVRRLCARAWGVPVVDIYSTQEIGYLALQCPSAEQYHVMAEDVIVEILDDDGRPCRPGQSGRVVATPLHNFATVLVRYDVGDYAEAGDPCACGRGLPVIRHVLGRSTNMMRLPDGRTFWPRLQQSLYRTMAPLFQMRIVQHDLDRIEFLYVADRPLSEEEQSALSGRMSEDFDYPFTFTFTRVAALPRSRGGKYEDFVCAVGQRGPVQSGM
jgi:phenylacetate-CoA ligase